MSSDAPVAVRVTGLSKCYPVFDAPGHRLRQFILPRIDRLMRLPPKRYFKEFWALRDLSFEILRGETVGIIGRNGSGKSTLLQAICGTLMPSAGEVAVQGRVAALLELGSGFDPEFTGRENVYLNASVLGLNRTEIDDRFDAIAAFADIGDFIDQPVKTYSSGMTVRLAFAVMAHVDADILVIDEALSVGDVVFTQKCMRFLRTFMQQGTVLFTSHDTNAVMSLCRRAIWLREGRIVEVGAAEAVCQNYLRASLEEVQGNGLKFRAIGETESRPVLDADVQATFLNNLTQSSGWQTDRAAIDTVELQDIHGRSLSVCQGGEDVVLTIRAHCSAACSSPILGWFVKDRLGQNLFGEHTFTHVAPPLVVQPGGKLVATFRFRLPLLPNGDYAMTVSIAEGTPENHVQHHWLHDALLIKVSSNKLRYGLVGIPFEAVTMRIVEEQGSA